MIHRLARRKLEIQERKEKEREEEEECWQSHICPKCGNERIKMERMPGGYYIRIVKYTCRKCGKSKIMSNIQNVFG